MRYLVQRAAPAGAVLALLVMASGAQAATKQVYMGTPPSIGKAMEKAQSDLNAFLPGSITVRVGQSVRFVPVGFHNADFPAKGGKPVGLAAPGAAISGANDAAGAAFWFNGQPSLGFQPALLKSQFGKSLTVNGSKAVNTGLPLADKPKPVTIRFTKTGTFTYYCDLHPGMKGTVKVVGATKSVPSPKSDAKRVSSATKSVLKTVKNLGKATVPANTVDVGVAGSHGEEYFGFVPDKLTVPTGSTVTFRMSAGTRDDHTATTGPGDPLKEPKSYLGTLAASFNAPQFAPAAVYPSDAPGTPASLTPTLHGNGFWNSGVMDGSSATPLPASNQVTFAAPGTYTFYCLIHPFMKATVTVQ